jgi:hypothetical protein
VLPDDGSAPDRVRLTQTGELRLKPDARWLRFTATQESSVHEVGFAWRGVTHMLPLLSVEVRDRYDSGKGSGEVRLFGHFPLMRDSGPEVTEGSALRYLAELPWIPHAMQANRELEWRELGEDTVEVATRATSTRLKLQFHFDAARNIAKAWTEARPHKEEGKFAPRPWGGVYGDYAVVGGIRIPTRAQVTWELPAGPFTWFRAEITSVEAE